MENACTLKHNCLGRVICVASDKLEHWINNGTCIELCNLLAKEGDGCVVSSGFTEIDLNNLPAEKS